MEKTNPASEEDKSSSAQLTPHELLQIHLKDPNHVVSDEEIKNLKVGTTDDETEVIKKAEEIEDEIKTDPQADGPPNPYEVLNG